MSVRGHIDLIQELKDSLVDDEALYIAKCSGGSGGGSGGGSATAPVTETTPSSTDSAVKAAGATAAAGMTYWVISESLRILVPVRNLVPVP